MSNSRQTARIGNDVRVDTPLQDKSGNAISLTGATLSVSLRNGIYGTLPVFNFAITGNRLIFDVLAKEMLNAGYYDLVVRIERNDGSIRGGTSTITVDKRRFLKIVPYDELAIDED